MVGKDRLTIPASASSSVAKSESGSSSDKASVENNVARVGESTPTLDKSNLFTGMALVSRSARFFIVTWHSDVNPRETILL